MSSTTSFARRRGRGFRAAASLVEDRVRKAGESRGFAVMRLLTRWPEIVGPDLAQLARPGKVSYGRGFGATLTLVCSGSAAPMVQMQAPRIVERVNACYGYAAISRIKVTQTAPEGFAEAQALFQPERRPDPQVERHAASVAEGVADPELRAALEALARNVLTRSS
ncbi:DUF721 domain-containing protein [Roseitranquillus sediminis]|uniref:DUF721 domain-containing protein n=1 Tax=Roseitranquillus sediminis TaxID=2809051 RepID=UPI001D0C0CAA|nr:DciA family protein [Roseitranquillus sediminis]MBM9593463.1 DUF721 domain-containing protein [Roseitranquillus sediminis]